jgi:hypothetical protein
MTVPIPRSVTKAALNAQRVKINRLEAENASLRNPSIWGIVGRQAGKFIEQNGVQILTMVFQAMSKRTPR